jgi:hypothetical protein
VIASPPITTAAISIAACFAERNAIGSPIGADAIVGVGLPEVAFVVVRSDAP